MKQFLKNNFTLLVAFALPLLLVLIVALTVYVPSQLFKATYSFLYATCGEASGYYYDCDQTLATKYVVENNRLVFKPQPESNEDLNAVSTTPSSTVHLFVHDTASNENREVTATEAQSLTLSGLLTSPDGVTVSSGYSDSSGDFFLFGGGSSYGYYFAKGRHQRKIDIVTIDDRYGYRKNVHFIGWITPSSSQ